MATPFVTYDQKGQKLSFANWISMISPEDTPFTSMTGKESINEIMFSWQTDYLAAVDSANAYAEGSDVTFDALAPTNVLSGYTQILRKGVLVSDTANTISAYGRGKELQYQMEKAGRAIKRDLESILLSDQVTTAGTEAGNNAAAAQAGGKNPANVRLMDGFASTNLVGTTDPDTGATVRLDTADFADNDNGSAFENALFQLTANLYTAGADCDVIMINPKQAATIAALQEKDGTRLRMFENSKQFIKQVNSITDPLGQTFKVIVNRWMPADSIYVFNASDWTQMVLRAPKRVQLAKTGSAEKWMIEMEVGLRHRNPYASGILTVTAPSPDGLTISGGSNLDNGATEVVTASKKAAK